MNLVIDEKLVLVVGIPLLATLVALIYAWSKLIERRVRNRIKARENFEAVATSSPLKNPSKTALNNGLSSIEERFRRFRWLILGVISVFGILIIIPLSVEMIPKNYSSFVIGAFTVVIGIASRPYLENIIAGFVLTTGQSLRIGDTVRIDSFYGTVEELNLTNTVIKIWNWTRFVIPNQKMMQKEFENLSLNDKYQWTHVEFYVNPNADLNAVKRASIEAMKDSPNFSNYEEPRFWVMELERNAIKCWVAGWADTPSDAWLLAHDARTTLATNLSQMGIFPQIHRVEMNAEQKPLAS